MPSVGSGAKILTPCKACFIEWCALRTVLLAQWSQSHPVSATITKLHFAISTAYECWIVGRMFRTWPRHDPIRTYGSLGFIPPRVGCEHGNCATSNPRPDAVRTARKNDRYSCSEHQAGAVRLSEKS